MKEKSHMCILTSKGKMPKTKYIMLTVVFSHLRWCCWTKQDTLCATIAQHVQHITDAQQKNWTQQSFKAHVTTSASISTISSTFNFLFKVLFIFPSWYLFAIGLKKWEALHENYHALCIPSPRNVNHRNSTVHKILQMQHWIFTIINAFFQKAFICKFYWHNIFKLQFKAASPNYQTEQILVHSPLLQDSFLVSMFHSLICLN